MHNQKLSSLYQNQLVSRHFDDSRLALGNREIKTLRLLMSLSDIAFPGNGVFLDLGCGDRYLERAVLDMGIEYIGLDIDTINFECDKLPIESSSINFAVSLAVLEHLNDPSNFLSEIFRCLKPGGIIYLSTPNFQYDFKNFYNDPTHVKPYTPIGLETILKLYNFEKIKTFPGLRCKSRGWYQGFYRFWRAFYLLPFRGDSLWAPSFLRGHARSIIALAVKPFG